MSRRRSTAGTSRHEDARPLRESLDAQVHEARVQAVWRAVQPRVLSGIARSDRTRGWRGLAIASPIAAALACAGWLLASSAPEPGILRLADGSAPMAIRALDATALDLADESRIELGEGASIAPTRNDGAVFALTLERGRARFSVTPGGPRRWTIDCGVAIVEVIGTVLTIARQESGVRVAVERGHVRVRAHDGQRWDLHAGDEAWVAAAAPREAPIAHREAAIVPSAGALEREAATEITAPRSEETMPLASRRERDGSSWTELAESGAYDRAFEALGAGGTVAEAAEASPRELLLLADVARLSGHPSEAIEPLERVLARHPGAPEAPLAAVVLGRVAQDALHAPERAARALERARELGVPAALAADVEVRLANAYLDLGDPRGVELARQHIEAHPESPRAARLAARLGADAPAR
jgi:transmembrane sensor